jgi:hypothetical protein
LIEAIANVTIKEVPNIQYIGLGELDVDDFTKDWIKKISSYYAEKIGFHV